MSSVKVVVLPLLLALIIALFSFSGCAGDGVSPAGSTAAVQDGLSQAQLEEIIASCVASQEDINTYRFDLDMDMITDVVGGYESGKMTIFVRSNGAANLASNQAQMNMEMSINMEGFAEQNGSQDFTYDVYMYPDWVYARMEVPGMGEQWMKMPTTEELEVSFNTDTVNQQTELLESALELTLLRYEDVDGEECYVISVVPDMEEFMGWVSQQQGSTQDIDWDQMSMIADIYKRFEYTCYITKDTNMLKRIVVEMEMEFTPEQAGVSSSEFDTMTMIMNMDMKVYDYNVPFSIDLPEEAEDAIEASDDMFM